MRTGGKFLTVVTAWVYSSPSIFRVTPQGLLHRSRGRQSNKIFSKELRQSVLELYEKQYADFGPTFYAEKLAEQKDIVLSDATIRTW